MTDPRAEPASPEPSHGAAASAASSGYRRLPTGPVPVDATAAERDTAPALFWEPATEAVPVDDARLAPWALVAAIVALATSMFVGWGIPVAVIAVIAAIMSLRRPIENRAVAIWALVLGVCATLFSAGWLIWATMQFEKLG